MNFEDALKKVGGNRKTLLWGGAAAVALVLGYAYLKNAGTASTPDPTAGILAQSPVAYGVPSAYGATNGAAGDAFGQPGAGASGTSGTTDLTYLTDLLNFQKAQLAANSALADLQAQNDFALGNASIASTQAIALANIDATKNSALLAFAANVNSTLAQKGTAAISGLITADGLTVDYSAAKLSQDPKYNVPLISAASVSAALMPTGRVGSSATLGNVNVPQISLPGWQGPPLAAPIKTWWTYVAPQNRAAIGVS